MLQLWLKGYYTVFCFFTIKIVFAGSIFYKKKKYIIVTNNYYFERCL